MQAAKPDIERRHSDLLSERYDLSDRPARGVMMERSKPVQEGVRAKLAEGSVTWEMLASLIPEEIRDKKIFPQGFYPLPHPNQPEGGIFTAAARRRCCEVRLRHCIGFLHLRWRRPIQRGWRHGRDPSSVCKRANASSGT